MVTAEIQPAAAATVFVDGETTPPEVSAGIVRGFLEQVSTLNVLSFVTFLFSASCSH
jgi:hypothetical protein